MYRQLLSILFCCLLFSCRRSDNGELPLETWVAAGAEPITATVQGTVYDESGRPASNVSVTVGAKNVLTDTHGFFRITGAALDKGSAFVTAEKNGYFKAYRSFAATPGSNMVELKLIRASVAGIINAAAGGSVQLSNGAIVSLSPNGTSLANGTPYTGTVQVKAAYIDPTAADFAQILPGSLMGNDQNGNRVLLRSYGMMAVELQTPSGQKLQVRAGSKALLSFPIPGPARTTAPATIPLWYVNDSTGVWQEEGIATLNGDRYDAEVKHFSFWNCDVPMNVVRITIPVKLAGGGPLAHTAVRLTSQTSNYNNPVTGFTDSLGIVSGYVPRNFPLQLEVLTDCGTVSYLTSIGPFSQETTLPAVEVTPAQGTFCTISGQLLDCLGAPLANGFALVATATHQYLAATDATGYYTLQLLACSGTPATITGIDPVAMQTASSTVTMAASTIAGTLTVCGSLLPDEFVQYTFDGNNYFIGGGPGDSIRYDQYIIIPQGVRYFLSQIDMHNSTTSFFIEIQSPDRVPGSYPLSRITINGLSGSPQTGTAANVSTYATVAGEYTEATFSGVMRNGTTDHTFSGRLRARLR